MLLLGLSMMLMILLNTSNFFLGILRYNPDTAEPIMLAQSCELSSFGYFQRGR